MPIQCHIADPSSGLSGRVKTDGQGAGAVVYTHPAQLYTRQVKFFESTVEGTNMAVDASFGGTPERVHNGGENALWSGSTIVGAAADFGNGDHPNTVYGGINAIEWIPTTVGSIIQFNKGSTLDLSGYTAITMYIYVDRRWGTNDNVTFYAWDLAGGALIGNAVNLSDYFDPTNFDVYQKLSIPLADMGLEASTIQYLRMELTAVSGGAPEIYIDDIFIEETGGRTYDLGLTEGSIFEMDQFRIQATNNIAGTNLEYEKFMGLTLATGLVYSRVRLGEVAFSASLRSLEDLAFGGLHITNTITDGTNTSLIFEQDLNYPITLDKLTDSLRIDISEDLSSLLTLRAYAYGREYTPEFL